MKQHKGLISLFSILIATALSCNFPSVMSTPFVDVDATLTSLALTQAGPKPPTGLPGFTATMALTPTITSTLSPAIPMVSVSVDTNCRTGPGVNYDYLTSLLVGEKVEVVGKYTSVSPVYWVIKKGSLTCWLWGQYATVEGATSALPEMAPPPSPTPVPTDTPTATSTPTSTPTATKVPGDLSIVEVFMSTKFEVIARIGTTPTGSLSGYYTYMIFANGTKTAEGNCAVPVGIEACYTGHIVSGVQIIEVVIDAYDSIPETNETNNLVVVTCDKFGFTCN